MALQCLHLYCQLRVNQFSKCSTLKAFSGQQALFLLQLWQQCHYQSLLTVVHTKHCWYWFCTNRGWTHVHTRTLDPDVVADPVTAADMSQLWRAMQTHPRPPLSRETHIRVKHTTASIYLHQTLSTDTLTDRSREFVTIGRQTGEFSLWLVEESLRETCRTKTLVVQLLLECFWSKSRLGALYILLHMCWIVFSFGLDPINITLLWDKGWQSSWLLHTQLQAVPVHAGGRSVMKPSEPHHVQKAEMRSLVH